MSNRLFDAGQEKQVTEAAKTKRDEARRRAAEFDQAAAEAGVLEGNANAVTEAFAKMKASVESVKPIRYDSYRMPGGRMTVEHAIVGDDYMFQVFPLRPPTIAEADVLLILITAMAGIFPKSVDVYYTPPADILPQKFYTVKVAKVATLPGWEDAVGRALASLASLDLWP